MKTLVGSFLFVLLFCLVASAQTFSGPHVFGLYEGTPRAMAVDVNGDGYADLVAIQPNSQAIAVKINNKTGGFYAAKLYHAGSGPRDFIVADFYWNGKLDIAVANAAGVAVLRGNGDGTFQSPVQYATNGVPNSIALGDFDGDNHKDIATLSAVTKRITILRSTGTGFSQSSYSAFQYYGSQYGGSPDYFYSLTSGDFNADGKSDLAYVDECDEVCGPVAIQSYFVLLNTGMGGWTRKLAGSGSGTYTLRAFDVDNDGRSDLVNAYYGCYHEPCTGITTFYSNANGTFTSVPVVSGYGDGGDPTDAIVGDFNNDGILDIAAPVPGGTDPVSGNPISAGFAVYTGKAGGRSFNAPKYFSTGATSNTPFTIASGFMRATGNKDVVTATVNDAKFAAFYNSTSRTNDPCKYPTGIGVTVCSPANGATTGLSVRVRAAAHVDVQPALRVELWVDGVKKFQTSNDLLDHTVTLTAGTHKITVVAVDAAGVPNKVPVTVTAQ